MTSNVRVSTRAAVAVRARVVSRTTLALLSVLAASCAPRTPVAGPEGESPRERTQVTVVVRNDMPRPTVLTVWAAARHGGRQMLGTVLPDRTESFRFAPDLPTGEYVLVGRTDYGAEIVSNPFPMSRTAVVSWTLFSNIATVTTTESDAP